MSESNSQQSNALPEPLKQHYERAVAAINRVSELAAGSGSEGLARLWNQIEGSLQSIFHWVAGIPQVRALLEARPEIPISAELAATRRRAEKANDRMTRGAYEEACAQLESELLTRGVLERDVQQVCEQIPKILEALDLAFAGIRVFLGRRAPGEASQEIDQRIMECIHEAHSEIQWLAKNAAPLISPESDKNTRLARSRATMPRGVDGFLNSRTLGTANRRLAEILKPGLLALDVGCGTGAITQGIAAAVAPRGHVLGVDCNEKLIEKAHRRHAGISGLSFQVADIYSLSYRDGFDIVTAARVLQWLEKPADALAQMIAAARPGGTVLVLDYNHHKITWTPAPPESMRRFYDAFLQWRAEVGMDNAMADHLGDLFCRAGLEEVKETPQLEITRRSDPDFESRIGIWADVAESRGHQMVRDGAISEVERAAAVLDYREWMRQDAQDQTLYLLAVEGKKPESDR